MSTAQFVNGNLFSLVSAVVNLFVSAELICSVKDFGSGDFLRVVSLKELKILPSTSFRYSLVAVVSP